jgi:hypothetical protein
MAAVLRAFHAGVRPDEAALRRVEAFIEPDSLACPEVNGETTPEQSNHSVSCSISPNTEEELRSRTGDETRRLDVQPLQKKPPTRSPAAASSHTRVPSKRVRASELAEPGEALSMLAETSIRFAAELHGRTGISGLDPFFKLSTLTEALEVESSDASTLADKLEAPAILTKGIVDTDTVVELFHMYVALCTTNDTVVTHFDHRVFRFASHCIPHLPLFSPAENSPATVCARSVFLFTVVCAVASRFHHDTNLHIPCYEEAHACFVDTVATGERSLESVQACLVLTAWACEPKEAEDRPKRASLYFSVAVRIGMELGLFRPPSFAHKLEFIPGKCPERREAWVGLEPISEAVQREALNRHVVFRVTVNFCCA